MNFNVSKTFDDIYKAYTSGLYRLIVAYGSSRSGKSYSIMQLFAIILITKKNYKITVWRGTRVDAVATVLEDFRSVIASDPELYSKFTFNKKDATFTCKDSGSIIHFMGTDVISKVLGMAQNISFFNEISHFSEEVFLQINQRTSDYVFSDYNPSREFFINKYESHTNSIFLRSTYQDNLPFLTDGIVNQLESYNPFEVGSTKIINNKLCYRGKPVSEKNKPPPHKLNVKNKTADLYMHEVYACGLKSEKPNRVYKKWGVCTDEFFEDLEYTSHFGLDFGTSSPTAMVEVKYDGDRTFYLHQRLYKPSSSMGMPLYEWIRTMMTPSVGDEDLIVCDSAKKVMVDELRNAGLKAVSALKGQGSQSKGITQVQSFNIVFTESSKDLEDEYFNYAYKIDRYGLSTDDIDPSSPDHLMDATRYIISYLIGWLRIVFK